MRFWNTLKRLWDPRTEEEKAYDDWDKKTPLQRKTVKLQIFSAGMKEPEIGSFTTKDIDTKSFGILRFASDDNIFRKLLTAHISAITSKGHLINNVWYSPIERIEISKSTLEIIEE